MSGPNPLIAGPAWDYAIIAGVVCPGLATIEGMKRANKQDKRDAYGTSGAPVVFTGRSVSEFTLKLWFWTAEQIQAYFDTIAPIVLAVPDKKNPKALEFYHAAVSEELDLRAVLTSDVGQLTNDGSGIWNVEIKFIEFIKPTPAVGKPGGANKSGKKGASSGGAKDAADAEIESNTNHIKALGDELANG